MRRIIVAASVLCLSSCGGGGGDSGGSSGGPPPPQPTTFSISTTALTFNANSPTDAAPISQNVVGTVTGSPTGTLYILIEIAGPAVQNVSVVSNQDGTGTGTIIPAEPKTLGTGTFQSTLTVRACLNDATCATGELSGSPRTINVTYNIGTSVQRTAVYPSIVATGLAGSAILREANLNTVSSVTIGGTPAMSFTQVSNTEVQFTFPALSAGVSTIGINGVQQGVGITAVDVPVFLPVTLTYPTAPTEIGALLYDAARQNLLVALYHSDSATNEILTYTFNTGLWSAPVSTTVSRLRSFALDNDGTTLVTVTDPAIQERSLPVPSLIGSTDYTPIIGSIDFLKAIAQANDGYFLVTEDLFGSGPQESLLFSRSQHLFFSLSRAGSLAGMFAAGIPGVSGDGSRIVIVAAGGGYDTQVYQYRASNGLLSGTGLNFANVDRRPVALDRKGDRIVLSSSPATNVYDGNYTLLGILPVTTRISVLNSVGTRAYTYDSNGTVREFDVSATANGGALTEIGTGIPVSDPGPNGLQMIITPDDKTVMIAGVNGIIVQPVTP